MVESVPEKSEVRDVESTTTATTVAESEIFTAPVKIDKEPEVIDLTDTSTVPVIDLVDPKAEQKRKCDAFNAWCHNEGVIMPKVEYPAYFEGGLVGVRALEPI